MEWIDLKVLNNCFRDKEKKHLGFKYEGSWYAITHRKGGIIIPKSCLQMREYSKRTEYLKKLRNTAPNILNPTSMKIAKSLVENYDEINKV